MFLLFVVITSMLRLNLQFPYRTRATEKRCGESVVPGRVPFKIRTGIWIRSNESAPLRYIGVQNDHDPKWQYGKASKPPEKSKQFYWELKGLSPVVVTNSWLGVQAVCAQNINIYFSVPSEQVFDGKS